jgi:hypothetical protein
MTNALPETVDGLPNISGSEDSIREAIAAAAGRPVYPPDNGVDFGRIRSACAIALHMHQPLIPVGDDLRTAEIASNLKQMRDRGNDEARGNANVFHWCYKRMGEFVPQLVDQGSQPRVMLDYSGTLLWGLRQMGLGDVFDTLRSITCDQRYRDKVEWLGSGWGHPVAPSTPVQDYRLHLRAWQHHFAALFGIEALQRVRGFSPCEMALPNHPDVAYEFVRSLRECGYQWVLVQEHTVERPDGGGPERKHLPHRLVCRNSRGETAEIIAIIKTQGSDTKLVAQMQPLYEARSLSRWEIAGRSVPPLVTQIADGENGGVMMNEFPPKYMDSMRECSGSDVPVMNVTEYLERLFASGVAESDLEVLQPLHQGRIWGRFKAGDGEQRLEAVIADLRKEDSRFNVEGGSWTNDISWVRGYERLLGPMEEVSSLFYEKVLKPGLPSSEPRYRNALFHLLCCQTSCYRYWGQGVFVDYGTEICRRAREVLVHDF